MGKTTQPESIGLFLSYPNPFNGETKIQFELEKPAQIELGIYNGVGQRVKTLLTGFLPQGKHDVRWNGKNQRGTHIDSGVYFCSLLADGVQRTIKLMMVR
jgi:flagellar hook assembly protein FlgD